MANARNLHDDDRLWRTLLWAGGICGVLFLGWQVGDYLSDGAHPAMQKNDAISAAASLAMLSIVGIIALRRGQIRRQAVAPAPSRSKAIKPKKPARRSAATPRRKRRA